MFERLLSLSDILLAHIWIEDYDSTAETFSGKDEKFALKKLVKMPYVSCCR
jgi:hypothetical protein